MQAYKALHPDKAQGTIFGPEANVEKSRGKKDLDAMEIDEIHKKKGKNLRYCQICAGKDFKNKAKSHNTADCYNVMPYKSLDKLSDILHLNNRNNQLERRARPPPETFL